MRISFKLRKRRRKPFNLLLFLQKKVIGRRGSILSKTWQKRGKPTQAPFTKWAPLDLEYRKQKIRAGFRGVADNMRTGKLKDASFAPNLTTHTPKMTVFRIPPEQVKYAGFINNGTAKMPARRFYDITIAEAQTLALDIAAEILKEGGF